ncbi:MAG: DUF4388 domain-containing protein [Bdellovibrionales bacterium]|nr:DUF4388 domain-containing protein [Bdellovibrionales bacterium]
MNAAPVTRDGFSELLRTCSHKRRNGLLRVAFDRRELTIAFVDGRIVSAADALDEAPVEVCRRLAAAGRIVEQVIDLIRGTGITVSQLGELLIGKGYVGEDDFARARQAYEIDLLLSLNDFAEANADFKPQLVRQDVRTALGIYPGQLLLDLEELQADHGRLQELFEQGDCRPRVVTNSARSHALTDAEQQIWDAVAAGGSAKDILANSLLSRHQALEALLSLYDKELITVTVGDGEQGVGEGVTSAESDISQLVAEEPVPHSLSELVEQAANELREIGTDEEESALEEASDFAQAVSRSAQVGLHSEGEESPAFESVDSPQGVPLSATEQPLPLPAGSTAGLRRVIRAGSYHLLSAEAVRGTVIAATVLFFFTLAVVGPGMFDEWFGALKNFTAEQPFE